MNAERSVHGASELAYVCYGDDDAAPAHKQRAAEAGAIEALVEAVRAHPQVADVQEAACGALGNMLRDEDSTDAAAPARMQRAVEAGALEFLSLLPQRLSTSLLIAESLEL